MADVLIVDDEPGVLQLLSRVVEEEGYSVATAPDGQAALTILDEVQPSLVLTDYMMPRLTGAELAAAIGSRSVGVVPPVVVMSANHQSLHGITGAAATLPKPFDLGLLIDVVDRFCGTGMVPDARPCQ